MLGMKLLCAYINLASFPFLKIIEFKISNIVGKIYATKLSISISQVLIFVKNCLIKSFNLYINYDKILNR